MIESQVAYIRDALKTMRKGGYDVVEVDQAETDRYNDALQQRMKRTVWSAGGCDSWYLDSHGKNTTLWPYSTLEFRRRLASFDTDAYTLTRAARTAAAPPRGRQRMKTLNDKVVVITGAGSGIGRALAVNLARRGSLLALSDVNETGLAETVALAEKAGAVEVRSDRLDVADRDAMARYALDVVQHFGRVNVVVNNAGVSLTGDFTDLEYADIDWIVGVNFWGVLHGTKEFLPHLIASGDGHVVNLSSLFGLISMPGPVDLQRHQVRRARHVRGAARGDAHRRPPGRRHLGAPRRHQDRHRPQLPGLRQGGQGGDRRSCSTRSSPR